MIRTLSVLTLVTSLGAVLAACGPGDQVEATSWAASLPPGEPVPDSYDWHFTTHGGSGDLDFGDGDVVEGVNLLHMSCLPGSRTVELSWGYPGDAVLTSGTATGTFEADSRASTNHPVFTALKAGGVIAVGLSGADMTLSGKEAGKGRMAAFFDYCDKAPEPVAIAETAVVGDAEPVVETAANETPEPVAPTPGADATPDTTAVPTP